MSDEIEDLAEQEDPILTRLKVKRIGRPPLAPGERGSYTMSEAKIAANRENAQKSTGPVTPEGKAITSQNAWKTGQFAKSRILNLGKPCKSTCPQYPCTLVDDGDTRPGGQCLDKEYMLMSIQALSKAMHSGELHDLKEIMTVKFAGLLNVINELIASINEDGVYFKSEKIGKDGQVIGYELKPNPSLLPLGNLLKSSGVTLTDFELTPAAISRNKTAKEATETIADILSGITRKGQQGSNE